MIRHKVYFVGATPFKVIAGDVMVDWPAPISDANAAQVEEMLRPVLAGHGVALIQVTRADAEGVGAVYVNPYGRS